MYYDFNKYDANLLVKNFRIKFYFLIFSIFN